jgi:PIN domain nuclease of toxin-antitoxin system
MHNDAVLLLDTCAIVYVSLDEGMKEEARQAIQVAAGTDRLRISPMSAWEIGMLMSKGRLRSPFTAAEFIRRFVDTLDAKFCELSPEILIDSSFLPGRPHGDPTDRILVATARRLGMVLATSDRPILAYGAEGHLRTLAC